MTEPRPRPGHRLEHRRPAGRPGARGASARSSSSTATRCPTVPNPGGVPQIRHAHGLLAGGREAMEEFLRGSPPTSWPQAPRPATPRSRLHYYVGTGPVATGTSGLTRCGQPSAPRVDHPAAGRGDAGRRPRPQSVLDLASARTEAGHRSGRVQRDRPGNPRRLEADLVVDASGRTSRTPEWLDRRGVPAARGERVRCDIGYATRRFRRRRGRGDAAPRVGAGPGPAGRLIIAQENDEWIAGLTGCHGVRPPTELSEFLAYARTLEAPAIAEVLERLEPLDDGCTYRFQASVRRRYERLLDVPDGILVIGDALCSFDPAFGQGMTRRRSRPSRCGRRSPRAGRTSAVASSTARRSTSTRHGRSPPGRRPTARVADLRRRVVDAYLARFIRAAAEDPVLATAFLRVNHLVDRPQDLMRPALARRVARHSLPRSGRWVAARRGHTHQGDGLVGAPGV